MKVLIQNSSDISIHQQIVQQVEAQILSGKISEGEYLPSVREFAKTYLINPNTVSKAYAELQRRGLVQSQRGKGMIVCSIEKEELRSQKKELIQKHIDKFVRELSDLGVDRKDLLDLIRKGGKS